ncbi:MAG: alcohol dehydrogenase [Planctomycetota bacterium]|nr:MAG: alcohol dehydrogenase [Planctomycetota bacterium]
MTATMLQGLVADLGRLELREVPVPEPGPGELVARVDLAMTCGTDLKTFRRGHPKFPLPTPLGHEFTGTVARVGAGVGRFREGDPILAVPSAPCGECPSCLRGLENLCDRIHAGNLAWGAFAEFIRIPAHVVRRNVFPRPPDLDLTHAALLEPLSCVVHGIEVLDLARRDTVLVLGAGPIGLLYVALLKRRGVPRVVVLGKRATRLAAARALGADEVLDLDASSDPLASIRALAPEGVCAAVECVGRTEAWQLAEASLRKGGEVLFYGGCPGGSSISLDTRRVHYDALTLKGAFHFTPSDVRIALDLIRRRALPLDRVVSGEYPLARLGEAFETLQGGECLKLAIRPKATDGASA